MKMTAADKRFMRAAVKKAEKNLRTKAGGPFGACIVKSNRIISIARNTVFTKDATCHAEINAIRKASRKLGTYDLSGCSIYSTTEPCPMCFSAIHWARINRIFYGTSISDAAKHGFNELRISNKHLKKKGKLKVLIKGGLLLTECRNIFAAWSKHCNNHVY